MNDELFNHYFDYSSLDNMLNRLSDAWGERNKNQLYLINEKLTKFKNIVKNVPKDKLFKIEENEKIIDIAEKILELNSKNQLRLGLRILTLNQILSRLPITLAQSKAGNNSEKRKNEIRKYCILCTDQKILTKNVYNNLMNTI